MPRVLGYGSQFTVLLPSSLSLQHRLCFCSWWKLQARVTSFLFFFFSLFIWNARVTVSPIVYLAPLSHPFPGNPKHRKPASSIGPKGDSRQHRALGIPTKESHAQHRQHIQFLWFSSSSSFNTKKKFFFLSGAWLQLLFFWQRVEDDGAAKHTCKFPFSLPVSFPLFLLLLSCVTSLKRKAGQGQKSLRKPGSRGT